MKKEDIKTVIDNGIVKYYFTNDKGVDMVFESTTVTITIAGKDEALNEFIEEMERAGQFSLHRVRS